jgi:hypothetical protein
MDALYPYGESSAWSAHDDFILLPLPPESGLVPFPQCEVSFVDHHSVYHA